MSSTTPFPTLTTNRHLFRLLQNSENDTVARRYETVTKKSSVSAHGDNDNVALWRVALAHLITMYTGETEGSFLEMSGKGNENDDTEINVVKFDLEGAKDLPSTRSFFEKTMTIGTEKAEGIDVAITFGKFEDLQLLDLSTTQSLTLLFQTTQTTLSLVYDSTRIPNTSAHQILTQLLDVVTSLQQSLSHPAFTSDLSITAPAMTLEDGPKFLHSFFEQSALEKPDIVALEFWDSLEEPRKFTYQEVNQMANTLATQIISLDPTGEPDSIVPIVISKSVEVYISILAVLKSGKAYCPVDPALPSERKRYILEEVKAKVVLIAKDGDREFMEGLEAVRCLEVTVGELKTSEKVTNLEVKALNPSNLAYVLFTSGTTGVPKGVLLTHHAATHGILSMTNIITTPKPVPHPKLLQFASPSFDVSVFDTFYSFNAGTTLVSAPQDLLITSLPEVIQKSSTTHLSLTPTVASRLQKPHLPTVSHLITIGEPASSTVTNSFALPGECTYVNAYGPTEAVITQSSLIMHPDSDEGAEVLASIGVPFPTAQFLVLHPKTREILPIGALGELCIAGPQLARGYLNREDLTCSKFFPITIEGRQMRVYATGDVVRMTPSKTTIFLGRVDDQVKLNGYRIEPEEINNVVLRHCSESVHTFATMVVEVGGVKRLVGFLELKTSGAKSGALEFVKVAEFGTTLAVVTEKMKKYLPTYMVPSALVLLNHTPLGTTGKMDRKPVKKLWTEKSAASLEGLVFLTAETSQPTSSTPTEISWPTTRNAQILRSVLSTVAKVAEDEIKMGSGIFHMGLDSIGVMEVCGRLRKELGVNLSVVKVMKAGNVGGVLGLLEEVSEDVKHAQTEGSDDIVTKFADAVRSQIPVNFMDGAEIYPATPLQEGLLVASQSNDAYYGYVSFTLLPETSLDRLRQAWEVVIAQTDILRTVFLPVDHENITFAQVVLPSFAPIQWKSEVVEVESEEAITPWVKKELQPTLNPHSKPPVAFTIFQNRSSGLMTLHLTIHHAIYDGWSLENLYTDVQHAYTSDNAPPPRTQFPQIVSSILSATSSNLDSQKQFWQNHLTQGEVVPFPNLTETTTNSTTRSLSTTITSTLSLSSATHLSSKHHSTPLQTPTQTAFQILLSFYTQTPIPTHALVLSSRSLPTTSSSVDATSVIGPLLNTVVSTFDVRGTGREVVRRCWESYVGMLEWQYTPLRRVQGWSGVEGGLYDGMFVFQKGLDVADRGEKWYSSVSEWQEADNLLTLEVEPTKSDTLLLRLNYKSTHLTPPQVNLLLHQYDAILISLLTTPDLPTTSFTFPKNLLSIHEMQPVEDDTVTFMHDLFTSTVRAHSNDPALAFCSAIMNDGKAVETMWTYAELDAYSNHFAHYLISKGLQVRDRVVLMAPKSMKWVVAFLGILKAGGVYVPVDYEAPEDRWKFVVEETEARFIVTVGSLAGQFDGEEYKTVVLDDPQFETDLKSYPEEQPSITGLTPEDTAYIVYTSGTTGRPKGVLITHSNIIHATLAWRIAVPVHLPARFLHFASPAFDAHIAELLYPFSNAMCLTTATNDLLLTSLEAVLKSMKVTHANLTPTVAGMLDRRNLPDLRNLITGGEPITPALVLAWSQTSNFSNAYGPTECSVMSSFYHGVRPDSKVGNIGAIIPNASAYVMSDDLVPVPKGVIGELCMGGKVVAKGYLNRPELTSEKFVTVAVGDVTEKVYRTGDLVRMYADGTLEFIGRADDQVKVNGIRLELDEVGNFMKDRLTEIVDSVVAVLALHPSLEKKQLVLFAVPKGQQSQEPCRILEDCIPPEVFAVRAKMARHMRPAYVMFVNRIPQGVTGKTDRKLLAKHFAEVEVERLKNLFSGSEGKVDDDGSEWTKTEEAVRDIIAKKSTISPSTIQRSSTMFWLGFDSLGAISLCAAFKQSGYEITVSELLQHASISGIAAFLDSKKAQTTAFDSDQKVDTEAYLKKFETTARKFIVEEMPEVETKIEKIYPCMPLQEGMVFGTIHSDGADYINQMDLQLCTIVDIEAIQRGWDILVQNTDILRTAILISPKLERAAQVLLLPSESSTSCVVKKNADTWEQEKKRALQTVYTNLIQQRPPVDLMIFGSSDGKALSVCLTMHHALYDGWSLPLLLADFSRASTGGALQPRPRFADFVRDFTTYSGPNAESFWREEMEDCVKSQFPILAPWKQISDTDASSSITTASFISQLTLDDLERGSRAMNATSSAVLQAGWGKLLAQYLGSEDVLFGKVLSGRTVPIDGVENLIAPCFNTLPSRVVILGGATNRDLVKSVQQRDSRTLPYMHTPLASIQKWTGHPNESLFDSLLVYQKTGGDTNGDMIFVASEGNGDMESDIPILVEVLPEGNTITLRLIARTNVIPECHATTLLRQFDAFVSEIVQSPDAQAAYFSFADKTLAATLYNTIPPSDQTPPGQTVHGTFEKQVELTPNNIAIAWATSLDKPPKQYTYKEINLDANKIARRILQKVRAPAIIPICMDKCPYSYTSVLGVQKAGCAYVPVDPELPAERKALICRNVDAPIILSIASNATDLRNLDLGVEVVALDVEEDWRTLDDSNLTEAVKPSDLAYVLFTSGTTGTPKGVMIEHSSVMSALHYYRQSQPVLPEKRMSQFASLSFDISVAEIFSNWHSGDTICATNKDLMLRDINTVLDHLGVTMTGLPVTLVSLIKPHLVPKLKLIYTGGETMPRQLLDDLAALEDIELYNAYGPTEATVLCTLTSKLKKGMNPRNIGCPLGESTIHIMTPDLQPTVLGGVGELCVSGQQLARGYLKNEDLTKEKFCFASSVGERIYRTGDLARALPDGTIEFLGRMDHQVKVNGLRIELEEIEGVISRSPSVNQVAATVLKRTDQERQVIVAFVTLREDDETTHPDETVSVLNSPENVRTRMDIRGEAERHLPQYMVPSHILILNKLPLGRTNKVDRKELAEIYLNLGAELLVDDVEEEGGKENEKLELIIRTAIAEVLGVNVESVNRTASFFQLGIDSINAIRLSTALRTARMDIAVSQIMKHQSASRLAEFAQSNHFLKLTEERSIEVSKLPEAVESAIREDAANLIANDDRIVKIYPCTPLQEGMIAQTLSGAGGLYFNFFTLELMKSTDVERLLRAFENVIRANDIFRTTFHLTNDTNHVYVQAVHEKARLDIHRESCDEEGLETAAHQYAEAQAKTQNLSKPPLCFGIFISPSRTILQFGVHHALYDGWSFAKMMGDIQFAYEGGSVPVRPQFDLIVDHLSAIQPEEGKEFWKSKLEGFVPVSLPNMHGRLTTEAETATHLFELRSSTALDKLEDVCKELEVSEQAVGQAAWAFLLSAYCGEGDVAFGHVVSGRMLPVPGIEEILGPTFNTILCRIVVDKQKTFGDLARQVHDFNIAAIQFHHSALRDITKLGELPADIALFDNIFLYQKNATNDDAEPLWKEIPTESVVELTFGQYAVSIEMIPTETGILWRAVCKANIMPAKQLSNLVQQLDTIFGRIVSLPTTELSHPGWEASPLFSVLHQKLPLRVVKKRTKLQAAFGGLKRALTAGAPAGPADGGIGLMHEYVERFARETPMAIALEFAETIKSGGSSIVKYTFRELNNSANQFANLLLKRGLKIEEAVPICMTRTPRMYIAVLGILKAGAAYVPIDPDLPVGRKDFILQDLGARFFIVDRRTAEKPRGHAGLTTICIDDTASTWRRLPKANLKLKVRANNLAYIIFTSGTTGTPKGVMIEHANVTSAMISFQRLIPRKQTMRFLQFASYNFDVSVFEIFLTWSVGGAVVTASKDSLLEDLELSIRELRVTHADLTPTISSLVRRAAVPQLEILVSGGEALTQQVLEEWVGCLYNAYGPTEATIGCTMFCNVTSDIHPRNIGKVFETCSAYILTEELELVPYGGVGELCIGGPQVARGYLKRPELTSKRFVTFAGERLYRTGDFARILWDENIEFLGRQDDQVKMNGLRIELEEINAVLRTSHPDIRDAVTLILRHPNQPRDQLVAFVATRDACAGSGSEEEACTIIGTLATSKILQKALESAREQLPQYMVPGIALEIPFMPLGSTGKAERKILAGLFRALDVQALKRMSFNDDIRPWSDMERKLQRYIAHVARVPEDTISRHTSVYHVGLDSVSVIRVRAMLKQEDGITLSVADIMRCGTLKRIAAHAENGSSDESSELDEASYVELVAATKDLISQDNGLNSAEITGLFPCTPLQEGMVSESIRSQGKLYFNHVAFVLPENINVDKLLEAWRTVTAANDILRTSFHPVNNSTSSFAFAQAVHKDVWLPVIRRTLTDENVDDVVDRHTQDVTAQICNLEKPPIYLGVFEGRSKTTMVLTIHHALYDGWSLPLILGDVQKAYFDQQLPQRLQFSALLNHIAVRPTAENQEFWQNRLKDFEAKAFPTNLRGTHAVEDADSSGHMHHRAASMSAQQLEAACRTHSISLQSVGQVAFSLLVSAYMGDADVAFGHVVSGRSISLDGVEGIIGPSFNTIPFRLRVTPSSTNLDLMRIAHLSNIEALPHHQTPLRIIQKWLPGLEGRAIFDTLFLCQVAPGEANDGDEFWVIEKGRAEVDYALCIEIESGANNQIILRASCKASVMGPEHLRLLLDQMDSIITDLLKNPDECISFNRSLATSPMKSVCMQQPLKKSFFDVASLHEYIERNAIERRDHPAVEFSLDLLKGKLVTLTYSEFNERANQLAHYLIARGVHQKTLVPVCMERSIWQYIALIAVMKTGAAYVPVEPSAPAERKSYIFKDVEAEMVIACSGASSTLGKLSDGVGLVILEDNISEELKALPRTSPSVSVLGSDLAYVIYTSGTTGNPKGVLIEHTSAVEAMKAFQHLLPRNNDSRFLQFASFAFDVSVFEMFFAWSTGITLVSAPKNVLLSNLEEGLGVLQVTHADLTPTVASLVKGAKLEVLVTGGETLTQQVIEAWLDKCSIFNAYGPTEATIGCTMTKVSKQTRPVNIGKPFPTCSAYVIKGTDVMPRGAVGELCIGGPHVARGYLKQTDLTAEKFVEIPGLPERVYRTGDVVRMLEDGNILYEGRTDDQVKINGLRIELTEINAVMTNAHADVHEAVTLVLKHPHLARKQLVAFVRDRTANPGQDRARCAVLSTDQSLPVLDTIRRACETKLPPYMVPSHFLLVDNIPLATTGKCNTRALGDAFLNLPADNLIGKDSNVTVSWSPAEATVCGVLADLSATPFSSIHRSTTIFQLGLDSINAIALVAKLKAHDLHVSISDIMMYPTVPGIASRCGNSVPRVEVMDLDALWSAFAEDVAPEILAKAGLDEKKIQDIYPCTPLQEGMVIETIKSEGHAYVNHSIVALGAETDEKRLLRAWKSVIEANDILRTSFHATSHPSCGFAQVVHREAWMPLVRKEVTDDSDAVDIEFQKYTDSFNRNLDWTKPPLGFAFLKGPTARCLIVSLHHALYDGWSLALMMHDVQKFYAEESVLQRPQYKGLVGSILSTSKEAAQKHWTNALKDATPCEFPKAAIECAPAGDESADRAYSANHTTKLTVAEVERACRGMNVSAQAVGQAAWGILLSAYIGETTVTFGQVLSGRTTENAKDIMGPAFNTVPCQIRAEVGSRNVDLVRSVHDFNLRSFAYQHTPLTSIMKWAGKEFDGRPLFDTLFLYQISTREDSSESEQTIWKPIDSKAEVNFAVALEMEPREINFQLVASCRSSTMPASHLNLLLSQFELVVTNLIRHPQSHILDLPMEDSSLLSVAHQQRPTGTAVSLASHVEKWAIDAPDHIALRFAKSINDDDTDVAFTYFELNRKANQLAHLLICHGVKQGIYVPICLQRSPSMYIAILAVLKAGGAYVPVDSEAPKDRQLFIFKDVSADLVLCDSSTFPRLCAEVNFKAIHLELLTEYLAEMPDHNPAVLRTPTSIAYLIYTSGTTGTPKGVVLNDLSASEAILSFQQLIPCSPTSRFLQFASFTFDVSVFEIFYAWSMGITLVTAPKHLLLSNLAVLIKKLGVTHMDLTPTVSSMLRRSEVPTIEIIVTGGETVTETVLQQWGDGKSLINAYGPTEATIGCTMNRTVTAQTHRSNIGQPFPSCSAFVVSSDRKILPRGAVGELCIGGPQVAAGYHNREGLTASKFFILNDEAGQVYATGDLVRMMGDGTIMFLGRTDHQVKRNGLRIELEEISSTVTTSHPTITGAVTLVLKHAQQIRDQIVTFFTSSEIIASSKTTTILTDVFAVRPIMDVAFQKARETLPAYMLPGLLIPVTHFPAGSTNKADIKVLTSMFEDLDFATLASFSETADNGSDSDAEITPLGARIRAALAEFTGVNENEVGLNTSIFHLGLDSISSIRLSSKFREFGIHLSVPEILQNFTVVKMAQHLNKRDGDVAIGSVVDNAEKVDLDLAVREALGADFVDEEIPRVLGQPASNLAAVYPCVGGQVFSIDSWAASGGKDFVHCFAFASNQALDAEKLHTAWTTIVENSAIFKTTFVATTNPELPYVQVVLKDSALAWNVQTHDTDFDETIVRACAQSERSCLFSLTLPPLRMVCLQFRNRTVLVSTIHHALYDGWSMEIILSNLHSLYHGGQIENSNTIRKNFLMDIWTQKKAPATKTYWRTALDTPLPSLLPRRPEIQDHCQLFLPGVISNATQLTDICRKHGFTMQALMLAAWAKAQALETDSRDVIFGLYQSGRSVAVEGVEKMAGPALNMIPLLVREAHDGDVVSLAQEVQETLVQASSYSQVYLHDVQRWVGTDAPIVNVFVNFLLFEKDQTPEGERLFTALKTLEWYADLDLPAMSPSDMGIHRESIKIAAENHINLEIGVSNDKMDIGLFSQAGYLTQGGGEKLVGMMGQMVNGILSEHSRKEE
ncbi:hypothetical protein HK097_004236 [Rhizophlyctis rosea]|uniref:Carrier domain-containing protein n=1 Tax=Rhizophlyctis rosea TaxID=64517 RepID=A0AAD5SG41_9FUNG|nr:hypothetical protein HK097_004236 [Rhizophlyctis rosea]